MQNQISYYIGGERRQLCCSIYGRPKLNIRHGDFGRFIACIMDSPGRHHDKGHRPYHNSPRGLQSMRTPERGPRIGLQGTGSQNSYDIFGLHGGGSRPVSGPYSPHTRHQPSQGPHGSIGPVDHSPGPSKRSIRPPPQRDSFRDHQHRTRDETDALLNEHRIVNLDRPSPMFPNAKWFCRLCHQHFNQVNTGVEHTSTSIHKKKKAALDLRKVVLALPRKPEPRHATALDTELRRVFGKYRMTAENLDKRRELVAELDKYLTESMQNSRLQNIVDKRWLKLKLNLQGSSLNGMGLATSDVNVDLHLPKAAPTDVQAKVFFEILHLLERWSSLQKVEPHFNQKVPKIKGVHCATNLALELGLGGTPALKTNRLLSDYASLDERVLPLAVCLRYWASKCRLDDPMFGTLPPHSFPIMTIYYLQQCSPPVLPCIHDALVTASAAAAAVSKAATAAAVTANNNSSSSNSNSNNNSSSNSNSNNTSSTTSTQNPVPIPSVPVFTEADGSGGVSSDQGEEDENDYVTPTKLADWKSENTASLAELWVGMLRFYSAEFKMRKVCVSLLTRKKVLLTARRWPSRYIGIEDPFCRKKSLSRSMINDQIMTYFLMCLRSSALYFNVPRTSSLATVYDPVSTLNIGIVEDPDGDDIEDGLAADEEADEDDDDQEKDNAGQESAASTSGSGAATVDVEDKDSKEGAPLENLAGWDQQLPQSIIESIANCDRLNYCMESVNTLTGGMTLPKACIVCRQPGHRGDTCTETQLPRPMNASPKAFEDADGLHTALCKYIHVNFRPAVSELELEKRVETVKAIEEFIQKTIPESYLTLFGSSRNGFSLEKADLDICLKYRGKEGIDEQMDVRDIIFRVATILDNHPQISDVQPIASAKVPIVKFHHDAFGVDGDISLYNVLAEHNTAMLHAYSCIDERVVPLGAALKQLVKLCDMGDASRGSLSSYAYVIMLIHYLQQEGIVPVLQKLPPIGHPKGKPLPTRMVDGWNAYYFDDMERLDEVWPSRGQNKKAIGQLWLGLIDYYSTKFKFDLNVVCIRQMEPLSRLEKMWTSKEINIEDPFELDHNLGTGVSSKMSKYIQSALITSRNWFLTSPGRPLSTTEGDLVDLYRHFMNPRELTVGRPPKDRGCKRCGKIGHWIKDCPIKANGESNGERRPDRRMCHHCGEIGHLIKDCGKRLQQIRQQRNAILPPLSMRNQHDMPRYSVPRSVDIRNEERHMHRESGSPERLAPGRRHHYHQQQAPPTPYAHDSAITAVAAAAGVTRISPRCLTTTTTVDGQGFDTVSAGTSGAAGSSTQGNRKPNRKGDQREGGNNPNSGNNANFDNDKDTNSATILNKKNNRKKNASKKRRTRSLSNGGDDYDDDHDGCVVAEYHYVNDESLVTAEKAIATCVGQTCDRDRSAEEDSKTKQNSRLSSGKLEILECVYERDVLVDNGNNSSEEVLRVTGSDVAQREQQNGEALGHTKKTGNAKINKKRNKKGSEAIVNSEAAGSDRNSGKASGTVASEGAQRPKKVKLSSFKEHSKSKQARNRKAKQKIALQKAAKNAADSNDNHGSGAPKTFLGKYASDG